MIDKNKASPSTRLWLDQMEQARQERQNSRLVAAREIGCLLLTCILVVPALFWVILWSWLRRD